MTQSQAISSGRSGSARVKLPIASTFRALKPFLGEHFSREQCQCTLCEASCSLQAEIEAENRR